MSPTIHQHVVLSAHSSSHARKAPITPPLHPPLTLAYPQMPSPPPPDRTLPSAPTPSSLSRPSRSSAPDPADVDSDNLDGDSDDAMGDAGPSEEVKVRSSLPLLLSSPFVADEMVGVGSRYHYSHSRVPAPRGP